MDSARGKQSSKRTAWRSFFRFNVPNVSRQPLESQVQTAECYRETRERMQFMCVDTIVHVYRYTRYLVAQWHSHTTRLELFYILHVGGGGASGPRLRRPPPLPRIQKVLSVCVFAALRCLENWNPRVCCYQTELVNWIGLLYVYIYKKKSFLPTREKTSWSF